MKIILTSLLFQLLFVCAVNAQVGHLPVKLVNRVWIKAITLSDGNNVTYNITFKQDSTFQLKNITTNFSASLKLKFDKDKIIFPQGSECSEIGIYKFSVRNNVLTLSLEGNDCKVREQTLVGVWKTTDKVKK